MESLQLADLTGEESLGEASCCQGHWSVGCLTIAVPRAGDECCCHSRCSEPVRGAQGKSLGYHHGLDLSAWGLSQNKFTRAEVPVHFPWLLWMHSGSRLSSHIILPSLAFNLSGPHLWKRNRDCTYFIRLWWRFNKIMRVKCFSRGYLSLLEAFILILLMPPIQSSTRRESSIHHWAQVHCN